MFLYLIIVLLASLYFAFKWKHRRFYELIKILGDHDLISFPLIGVAHLFIGDGEVIMNGIETLGRQALKNNGLIAGWLAHKFFVVIADPVAAEHVSRTCLQKHEIMHNAMNVYLRTSSIIAPVTIWHRHRRILAPTFCTKNIKQYTNIFAEQSKVLVEQIRPLLNSPIPTLNHFMKYTMESISQSTLGVKLDIQKEDKQHPFLSGIEEATIIMGKRFVKPWLMIDLIYKLLPCSKTLAKITEFNDNFLDKIISSLRKSDRVKPVNKFKSLMELLVASSESEQELSDQEIREEALGVALAATETTALSSGYISYLLAEHPEVQEKAYKELIDIFGKDEPLTSEGVSNLNYLDAVVKEALRLYPPVPIIVRIVEEDCELPSGVVLPAGCGVLLHLSAINRNPEYWGADADQFRPERFLDSSPKHPAQFSTFSFGPRNCIGKAYAMTSLKSMIATVLRNYRFTPACTTERASKGLRLTYAVTMRDINNFPVQLQLRA